VYFSTAPDGSKALVKTIDVVTDSSGQFQSAYVFFTKAGDIKVTATADGKSSSATVTTDVSNDAFIVSDNDAFGTPGEISLSGKLVDVFGNPVKATGNAVDLAVTPAGSGHFKGLTTSTTSVETASDGSWSAIYVADAGAKGDFVVTATAHNVAAGAAGTVQGSNRVIDTTWATTAGIKDLPDGQYKDTAKLTVGPIILTAPASRVGEGMVRIVGVANPNSVVLIRGRAANSTAGLVDYTTVTADAKGDFQFDAYLTATTSFVAVSNSQYSPTVTVAVTAPGGGSTGGTVPTPVIKAFGAKAAGKGIVNLTVIGNGDTRSKVIVSILSGKTYKVVKTYNVDKKGVARATIKTGKGTKTFKIVYKNDTKTLTKVYTVKVK
jgi:hypothetical protein